MGGGGGGLGRRIIKVAHSGMEAIRPRGMRLHVRRDKARDPERMGGMSGRRDSPIVDGRKSEARKGSASDRDACADWRPLRL